LGFNSGSGDAAKAELKKRAANPSVIVVLITYPCSDTSAAPQT
jgi:hypothetical protein